MFSRISNSWELVKQSWSVLKSDKELLIFPIASSIALFVVFISFLIPIIGSGILQAFADGSGSRVASNGAEIVGLVVAFVFYLINYTIITFSNTALIGAAMIRLRGGDPTARDGWRIAQSRIGTIIGYAAIAATVGMILRAIQNNDNIIAKIVAGIIGFAWSIATYMVVPVLVVEDIGPIDAIKRSASLLRQTWGEQLIGEFSIGTIFGLLMFGAIFLIGAPLFFLAASSESVAMIILAVTVVFIIIVVLSVISSTLSGIFQAALYLYATEGTTGGAFSEDIIAGAFKEKNKRG